MATQLKEPENEPEIGTTIPGEGDGEGAQTQQRDYEAEATEHGWSPKDDFKGDPSRWVDAETFMRRADEMMPLLRTQNKQLKRDLADLKKEVRRASDFFSKSEQRGYERAMADLTQRQEEAVEAGDVTAHRQISKEIDKLREDLPTPAPLATKEEAAQVWEEWRETNPWYDRGLKVASASETEVNAALYADRMTEKHMEKTQTMPPAEFFAFIEDLVVEKFPAIKTKPARTKPPSDVAGATNGRGKPGGKSWGDITDPEMRRQGEKMAERWVKSGLLKNKDDYLKGLDWSKM